MGTGASKESTAEGLKNARQGRTSTGSSNSSSDEKENILNRLSSPEVEPTSTSSSTSRCPMANVDGSHSWDLRRALGSKSFPHWIGGSKPLTKEEALAATLKPSDPEVGCPVKKPQQDLPSSEGCPVKHRSDKPEYNVYAQPLDPSNQMPSNPNQLPAPHQAKELSTDRVSSTIPKGGAATSGSTWTYPSQQMFYNALARKGKLNDDTAEEDIASVVALHNNMNEKTWQKVLQWEETISGKRNISSPPKLLKFQGRPTDLSPKAAFKHYVLGHPLPYDRHDWTVERSDGTTARYVIDYYHDECLARNDPASAHPGLHDSEASRSLLVDVRPAADDLSQVWNRLVTMPYARRFATTPSPFDPLPLPPSGTMKSQVAESVTVWQNIQAARRQQENEDATSDFSATINVTAEQAKELASKFDAVRSDCRAQQNAVDQCSDDYECPRVSLDLTICLGQHLCSVQHKALVERLIAGDDAAIDAALQRVSDCVVLQTERQQAAKEKYPQIFS